MELTGAPGATENLDQVFSSAAFAMKFAAENWQEFSEFTEKLIGRPVPVSRTDMLAAGLRVLSFIDPTRMR